MTLLLLAGLGACDKQSPPAGQGPNASEEATGPGQSGAPGKEGAFSYTIDRSKAGTPAPDFTFQNPDGSDAALKDFAGKPMLVNLWATWCAPCVKELPTLDALSASSRIRVLAVSQDTEGGVRIASFLKEKGAPHLQPWLDPENDLSFHYATGTLPTSVLYDAQGREVWRFVGENDWSSTGAAALIAEAG